MNQKKGRKFGDKLCAPLYIMKEEKLYIIWFIFIIFFGLINIWAGLLLGLYDEVRKAFNEGIIYTYSISICAPFFADIVVKYVEAKKTDRELLYVTYKTWAVGMNVILICILQFLWLGTHKGIILQSSIGVLCSIFAFYMYCIGQMEIHNGLLSEYNDGKYLKDEKSNMASIRERANIASKIENEEGEIEL